MAPVSDLILVFIWFVIRTAMFLVAASLPILEMKSPITAHRLPEAPCIASLLLIGVCWLFGFSADLGKASAKTVATESMTITEVSDGGNPVD